MRTLTPDMNTSIHKEGVTLAHTWKFTRTDGTALRITDHDASIVVPGDGVYRAQIGFTASSAVNSAVNFSSQTAQCVMAMTDDGLRETDVRQKKWKNAVAVFGVVDWVNPTSLLPIFTGNFGRIVISEKHQATIEILGLGASTVKLANELYSMTCRHSLGDTGCLVNLENFRANFTVVSVTDSNTFGVSDLRGQPDGFYSLGQLIWDTGQNAGDVAEVQTSLQLTNELGIFFPMPADPQIGDTGHVYPGCELLIETCFSKFNNVVNFDGEPYNVQPRIISAPASSGSIAGAATATGNL